MRETFRTYTDGETIANLMSMLLNLGIIQEYAVDDFKLEGVTIRGTKYGYDGYAWFA